MWRFKPFAQKEPTGLEGRFIDVGNLKIHVRNAIAGGGFSCVYLAQDAVHSLKQYALKHMICNDDESLELALKEINVMKSPRGHPNIVTLCAHAILDMVRTKEVLLVMEFCEKSLVSLLESSGAGYFEEKQVLLIFRDACNAVFAMHSVSTYCSQMCRDIKKLQSRMEEQGRQLKQMLDQQLKTNYALTETINSDFTFKCFPKLRKYSSSVTVLCRGGLHVFTSYFSGPILTDGFG